MEGSERGHRSVHAGKAVGAPVKTLHKGEKFFRPAPPHHARAPFGRCRDGNQQEKEHLETEEQHVAQSDVEILARRRNRPVDGHDDGVIEKAVNPDPARAIRDAIVNRQPEFAGFGHVIPLAPEIELVNTHDQKRADDELNDAVDRLHGQGWLMVGSLGRFMLPL